MIKILYTIKQKCVIRKQNNIRRHTNALTLLQHFIQVEMITSDGAPYKSACILDGLNPIMNKYLKCISKLQFGRQVNYK